MAKNRKQKPGTTDKYRKLSLPESKLWPTIKTESAENYWLLLEWPESFCNKIKVRSG